MPLWEETFGFWNISFEATYFMQTQAFVFLNVSHRLSEISYHFQVMKGSGMTYVEPVFFKVVVEIPEVAPGAGILRSSGFNAWWLDLYFILEGKGEFFKSNMFLRVVVGAFVY